MRISDWSSDVCSSDLPLAHLQPAVARDHRLEDAAQAPGGGAVAAAHLQHVAEPGCGDDAGRGPAPLQQRVGADRGAVHHRGDRGDPVDPRLDPGEDALGLVRTGRRDLADLGAAGDLVEDEDVGEGPADVDADHITSAHGASAHEAALPRSVPVAAWSTPRSAVSATP